MRDGHKIREFVDTDWASTWSVLEPVFRAGETFPMSPDISEEEAYAHWVTAATATYVYLGDDDRVLGTYYMRPNQPPLGAHVCNCGYIVAQHARGAGIASAMCLHSQTQAIALRFRAMQFNLVVANNAPSLRVWEKHGFKVVGTLPKAFLHRQFGYVDALLIYKELVV